MISCIEQMEGGEVFVPKIPSMKVIDLSQDFSMHTPAFAGYAGPSITWRKRLAFERAGKLRSVRNR